MNNYRNTLTAAARVLSIMRDDAIKEVDELRQQGGNYRAAEYRRDYATQALEAVLCLDPDEAKEAERYMRARL